MEVQTDTVSIKSKADVTPDFLAQVKSKDSCAGTFHSVDGCEYPCIGNGMLVKSYEQRRYSVTHAEHKEAIGLLRDIRQERAEQMEFGDTNPKAMIDTVTCQPKTLASCPCVLKSRINEYDKALLESLGVESIPKLRPDQEAGLQAFKKHRMSLFIYGESRQGKTVLAAACGIGFHRKVKVLAGDEISAEWRRKAFDNQPLDYDGLLILDDVDKTMPTDSFKEKLWYIFDRVAKRKLRLIITTNLTPMAFAEKYTSGSDESKSMITRLGKFEAVKL